MKRLLFPLLALLLSACAVQPIPRGDTERRFEARQVELAGYADWTLTGRIAVAADEDGWSANLRWQQRGEDYRISIFDPLGRTLARLEGTPGRVTLRTSEGESYQAANPETLLYQQLGWQFPVQGLRHWVLGVPRPDGPVNDVALDGEGRPAHLSQDGWGVDYSRYEAANSHALPARMVLARDSVRIKLAVDSWRLGS